MRTRKRILLFLCCFCGLFSVFALTVKAQDLNNQSTTKEPIQTITGTVSDELGPMIGVSVSVPGTTLGVIGKSFRNCPPKSKINRSVIPRESDPLNPAESGPLKKGKKY